MTSSENVLPGRMSYLVRRVKDRLRNITRRFLSEGFKGVADRISHHMRWARGFRERDAQFDKTLGVNTKGPVGLWHLSIRSDNLRDAIRYEGVPPSIFRAAFSEIREDLGDFTFVDLGCGKGRALLLAKEFGFAKSIGVEFAPELAAVARKNCERAGVEATVLAQDAAQFVFPSGNLVVYLYNPFGPTVMNPVLDNLLAKISAKCYVVYVNPVRRQQCFDSRSQLRLLRGELGYAIWTASPRRELLMADVDGGAGAI
jgi:predicted RNA methylase